MRASPPVQASWRWAGALATGTSHVHSGVPCQDFAGCRQIGTGRGPLVAVVSDGAGSAARSRTGSRLTCSVFVRAATEFFSSGRTLKDASDAVVNGWIENVRVEISALAALQRATSRDYAATLVAVLADAGGALVVHVGDGAAVVRKQGTAEWLVPSWPFHGEYASMTTFVTDLPKARVSVQRLQFALDRIAVFSDGIERLVLDHGARTAFAPFFDRMFSPLAASGVAGQDRGLSRALREYLGSPAVCDRTDDDKSLILAVRR
jgi:hypothetical protein